MKKLKSNTAEETLEALEVALRLLEKKSLQKADAGACHWQGPKGKRICVRLTHDDCDKIPGMIYIGGTCKDALNNDL
jgi:hypothetical protein